MEPYALMHKTVASSAGTTLPEWQADEVLEEFRQLLDSPPGQVSRNIWRKRRKLIRDRALSLFYVVVVTLCCGVLFLHKLKLRTEEEPGLKAAIFRSNDTAAQHF